MIQEIDADREVHGKKPLKKDGVNPSGSPKEKTVIESTTDPESSIFHKGEHKKCFAYYERLIEHYPQVDVVTVDAGYKTPWICKKIMEGGRIPSLPYKRPMTGKGNLPWYEYVFQRIKS